jgi:hypothetical protein
MGSSTGNIISPITAARAFHVGAQVFPGFIPACGQIHGHSTEEAVEALWIDASGDHSMNHGCHHGVGTLACGQVASEALGECVEAVADQVGGVRESRVRLARNRFRLGGSVVGGGLGSSSVGKIDDVIG